MPALAQWAMRGPIEAAVLVVVFAVLSWYLPPLAYLAGAVVALLAMQLDGGRALAVTAAATAVLTLLSQLLLGSAVPGLVGALLTLAPVAVLGDLVRRQGALVVGLIGAGVVGMLLALAGWVLPADPPQWWLEQLRQFQEQIQESASVDELTPGQIQTLAVLMPGLVGMMSVIGMFISLILGRWWQALLYNPGGFQRDFHALSIGRGLALALVVFAALGATGMQMAANVALAGAAAALFHGLAIVHALASRLPQGIWWLVPFYVLLVFMLPYMAVMLAVAGVLDTVLDFRRRGAGGDNAD